MKPSIELTLYPSGKKIRLYKRWVERFPAFKEFTNYTMIGNIKVVEDKSTIAAMLLAVGPTSTEIIKEREYDYENGFRVYKNI